MTHWRFGTWEFRGNHNRCVTEGMSGQLESTVTGDEVVKDKVVILGEWPVLYNSKRGTARNRLHEQQLLALCGAQPAEACAMVLTKP